MADLNNITPMKGLPPFLQYFRTVGIIPASYKVSMTYEEQVLELMRFIKDEIIPKINENVLVTQELQEKFRELVAYVDEYFENLDVQTEVNTKLNEMADSGQLAEIIAQYVQLQGILSFNNVHIMKNATNLVDGAFVRTYGFNTLNDKGGAFYKIRQLRNDDVIDNMTLFKLDNTINLVAELVLEPIMYVEQFGAIGDGETDTTVAIQTAVEKHQFGTLHFGEGTFVISEPIKTYVDNIKQTNFVLEKTTIIKANTPLECLFEFGALGGSNLSVVNRFKTFTGGILNAENCTCAIKINPEFMGLLIEKTEIQKFEQYGVYIPAGDTIYSSDISFKNMYINGRGSQINDHYGFYIERPDNKFEDLRVNAIQTAFYCTQGGQILHNVHGLVVNSSQLPTNDWFENTKFFVMTSGGINILNQCYCDSFCTFVDSSSQSAFILTNSAYFSYLNNVNLKLFILRNANCRYTISNNTFELPTPVTKHKGIIYTSFNNQISLIKGLVYINNNQISLSERFEDGDLINQFTDSYTPFWLNSPNGLQTVKWALLGYVTAGYQYHQLKLNVEGYNFVANFKLERYGTNTYVSVKTKEKTNTNVTLQLGFKYIGNNNGYPIYAVYLRQTSGTPLKPDITVEELNKNTPFIPAKLNLRDVAYTDEDVDGTYTL